MQPQALFVRSRQRQIALDLRVQNTSIFIGRDHRAVAFFHPRADAMIVCIGERRNNAAIDVVMYVDPLWAIRREHPREVSPRTLRAWLRLPVTQYPGLRTSAFFKQPFSKPPHLGTRHRFAAKPRLKCVVGPCPCRQRKRQRQFF